MRLDVVHANDIDIVLLIV
jgi:hypothetical protein